MKIRDDNTNATFEQFVENIGTILNRQNEANPIGDYDTLSQDVLIPAFISAYTGQNAGSSKLSPFPKIPMPNWRIDYTGLSKIPWIAERFSSFTVAHGYRSIYNVNKRECRKVQLTMKYGKFANC